MKVVAGIAIAIFVIIILWVAALALLPSDVVTSRYATLTEARADHLFERGWLPDILPSSATDIRTSNNLDLNVSEGEFSFAQADGAQWFGHLRPYQPLDEPFAASADEVSYCKYYMWLRRTE